MQKKQQSFLKNTSRTLALLALVLIIVSCEADHKALIEKTLENREEALNDKDVKAYLALVSKNYQYKPESTMTIRKFMEENLLIWDVVHIQTYNRLIYIEGRFARVSQDYQLSVQKKGKTQLFSGAEHFLLQKEGFIKPVWRFVKGLDAG